MLYRFSSSAWSSRRLAAFFTLSLIAFLFLLYHLISWRRSFGTDGSWLDFHLRPPSIHHNQVLDGNIAHLKEIAEWEKPEGMKVIALVFYGRRRYVEILDCYLKVHVSPQ
jgi:hypothetical protein